MFSDYFSIQVFFLVFRETLETAVIVSVLLAFLRQGLGDPASLSPSQKNYYRALFWQVWIGAAIGLLLCVVIGGIFLTVFYLIGTNIWDTTEKLWEAVFCVVASVMISFMGIRMLKINKLKKAWRLKLARMIVEHNSERDSLRHRSGWKKFTAKYSMAVLPLVTTLREGLEAIMFLGGLGTSQPSTSFPLAVITAIATGTLVGVAMYRYGEHVSIKAFLVASTCFLYLVAAGLFSRGVWFFEINQFIKKVGQDLTEVGSGPGSYDITQSVWHVNCCNPETDGPWMIFNALLGWQNSATYASVTSYILYWAVIVLMVLRLRYKEKHGLAKMPATDEDLFNRATNVIGQTEHDALLDSSRETDNA